VEDSGTVACGPRSSATNEKEQAEPQAHVIHAAGLVPEEGVACVPRGGHH
jgi:hypothetical protein